MEMRMLENAEKILLGSRQRDDGTWRAVMIVTYHDQARKPFVGETPDIFASSDAAKEWADKHVAPLLNTIGTKDTVDANRPQGLHCTRYEWVGKEKVYCGRTAQFHLAMAPVAEDEYICEEHVGEIKSLLSPELEIVLRRIN